MLVRYIRSYVVYPIIEYSTRMSVKGNDTLTVLLLLQRRLFTVSDVQLPFCSIVVTHIKGYHCSNTHSRAPQYSEYDVVHRCVFVPF
ncbi:hypothetical protein AMS69_01540 [Haloarcula rubripromontorii]|uniref:Uncharacterized protein n=1 Tax=Haloarcula rubripromontorii TaxID=1705562 RepID=A0A0N0BPW9_9EURY|nr:hypothetical protein AMS69_01540 [Haloarcula rubripromontorii]